MGGVAAAISKAVAAHIKRVKPLVQNHGEMLKPCITDCFARTDSHLFWRSNNGNIIRVINELNASPLYACNYFPTQTLNFAFKDKIEAAFAKPKTAPYWQLSVSNIAAGGAAGAARGLFVYSLDYTPTRLSTDAKAAERGSSTGEGDCSGHVMVVYMHNSPIDVYKKALKDDGIAGLYRGFAPNLITIVVHCGCFDEFVRLYDSLKLIAQRDSIADSFLALLLLDWGIVTASSYPFDTIRRHKVMTNAGNGTHYANFYYLFKGAGANVTRSVVTAKLTPSTLPCGMLSGYDHLQLMKFDRAYEAGTG
ncbi:mitochondrial carrier [Tilletiaria anomala UBC 951]|uniref:ADP/ATP translocase n=1 Tax=Tilletiaria anomala (strain ATCC 24038 / CBS 436.72 / UBC 951) TaxID=1037660 RepID=A0A066V9X7_TILAU|nr:mitochondrial carrier [Tilletiaria anomala UBC 951]KDN38271.1 mitochondrial carrier [Tilletiaria anomala UBC 951]